jgi:hypothetical protein
VPAIHRRAFPLLALLCAPFVSTVLPLLAKPPRAVMTTTSHAPDGVATFNAQGVWGTLTIGGRFNSGTSMPGILSFTVSGRDSSAVSVPIDGELVTYQRVTVVSRPRDLRLVITSDRGHTGLSLENVSVSWTVPHGLGGRVLDALVAWTLPHGLPGVCYQSLLILGIAAACMPRSWRRNLAGPWVWWIGSATLAALSPGSFSPLTRLIAPGGISLSTLVLCGAAGGLVASVAGGRCAPRAAGAALLFWAAVARLTTFPLSRDWNPGDVDEIVYAGVAESVANGRGFILPDAAYKGRTHAGGDPVRASWWEHELYLGVARRGEPTAAVPPLYPLMLAAFTSLGLHDFRWVCASQALFGLMASLLAGIMGRRIGGVTAGIGAMALGLLHSPAVAVTGFLFTESLFVVLLMAACALLLSDRPVLQIVSCALIGLAGLTRPVALATAPLWPLYVAFTNKGRARWLALIGCALLGVVLTPWAVRNHRIYGEPVVGSTLAGKDFFMGNNDAARRSGSPPSWDWFSLPAGHRRMLRLAGFGPNDMTLMYKFPADIPSETSRDRELRRKAAVFVLAYPTVFLARTAQRVREFTGIDPPPEPWEHVGQLPFLFVPALFLATLAFWTGLTRQGAFLAAVAVLLSVVPIISVAYSRYRLPVDFTLFPLAGVGLAVVLSRIRRVTNAHGS